MQQKTRHTNPPNVIRMTEKGRVTRARTFNPYSLVCECYFLLSVEFCLLKYALRCFILTAGSVCHFLFEPVGQIVHEANGTLLLFCAAASLCDLVCADTTDLST